MNISPQLQLQPSIRHTNFPLTIRNVVPELGCPRVTSGLNSSLLACLVHASGRIDRDHNPVLYPRSPASKSGTNPRCVEEMRHVQRVCQEGVPRSGNGIV